MEGRLNPQVLCGAGAALAAAAGALAFVTPFAAVGAGLLAASAIGLALCAERASDRSRGGGETAQAGAARAAAGDLSSGRQASWRTDTWCCGARKSALARSGTAGN